MSKKIYLVGGAVRDELLGIKPKERDFVVVGATPDEMLKDGFKPVGKDFPVFLHPDTHEEYALARTERKNGHGYYGFTICADPSVTLVEDLKRRDLTINAIAKDEKGNFIDPYHGIDDLQKKILRHVSPAFSEDPVRVLRIARFNAKFPDFTIAKETIALMQKMGSEGELNFLVPERVFLECKKALTYPGGYVFFEVLKNTGVLSYIFPELAANFALMIDLLRKTRSFYLRIIMVLVSLNSLEEIRHFAKRLCVPRVYTEVALVTFKFHQAYEQAKKADDIVNLLESLDAFRQEKRFFFYCRSSAIFADFRNRLLEEIYLHLKDLPITDIVQSYKGEKIREKIHERRIAMATTFLQETSLDR